MKNHITLKLKVSHWTINSMNAIKQKGNDLKTLIGV